MTETAENLQPTSPVEQKAASSPPSDAGNLKSALSKMKEGNPQVLQEILAMSVSSGGNPLHQKMNEEHVTQVLSLATQHDERQFELTKQNLTGENAHRKLTAWFSFVGGLAVLGLVVFLVNTFKDKPEVLTPILSGLGGLVVGGFGGFGIGRSRKND